MSVLLFLVILLLLVLVHEWGHFITAKKAGIRVDEFAFGFPPRLFSIRKGETNYSFNLLPLGGYVKIFGEDPTVDVPTDADKKRSFAYRHRGIQAAVIVAGVAMNMVLAVTLLTGLYLFGIPASALDPELGADVAGARLTIIDVRTDSPAARAGLLPGDVVLEVTEAEKTLRAPASTESVTEFIGPRLNIPVSIAYERGGAVHAASVTPTSGIVADRAAIGITMDMIGTLRLPPHRAALEGITQTYRFTKLTAAGLAGFIGGIFMGEGDLSSVTGPVGIVNIVGQAAENGLSSVVMFTALISINLAIINLLPFPALDGGRLLFIIVEGVARRRIPFAVQNWANTIGFALLLLLMLAVTVKDVAQLW